MTDIKPFLKDLLSLPGLSAHEAPVRSVIAAAWEPLVDELTTSRVGSLHGLRRGRGAEPRRRILLSAHMDAIGMMVTQVVDGFLRFTGIGGVDRRILPGQPVTVHGRRDLPAVVVLPPERLLPPMGAKAAPAMQYLLVDTGLRVDEMQALVQPGDLISFAQEPLDLGGETIAGHSLDNRASVAAVTHCLHELSFFAHRWDVWAVASAQEEETLAGAFTSPFDIHPDLAVAIDVTFAKSPGSNDHRTFALGKGVTIGWGPNIHPGLYRGVKELADQLDIPCEMEPMPRLSGTDAMAMQLVGEGIPTLVVSIPLRYMHTPVELVAVKDIKRAGHLLAEYIARLDDETMDCLTWDK